MNAYVFNRPSNALHRIGMAGFMFFLIKGMLWLTAPFVFMYFT